MVPEGIVVLNISSFMGGTNFWGSAKDDNIFLPPSFDDGILEVSEISTNKKFRQNTKCSRRAGGSGGSREGGGGHGLHSKFRKENRNRKLQSITFGPARFLDLPTPLALICKFCHLTTFCLTLLEDS